MNTAPDVNTAPVVSNSSPLMGLHVIGQLPLLHALFGQVLVPPAVAAELSASLALPDWVETRTLARPVSADTLAASLGSGESGAVSLAQETGARLVILDDRPSRRHAQKRGLHVIGTLGLLLAAKRRGLLPAVRPCLVDLLAHDFRIAPALYERVLRDAGEDAVV